MANWFECKVAYRKIMENGIEKKVNDTFLVDALTFTEAESRIIEEITPFISGEFSVSAVKRTKIAEIFWDDSADRWYLTKVAFITIDENSAGKEIHFTHTRGGKRLQRRPRALHRRDENHDGRLRNRIYHRDSHSRRIQSEGAGRQLFSEKRLIPTRQCTPV